MTEKTLTLDPLDQSAMCCIIYTVLGDCEELRAVVHNCLTARTKFNKKTFRGRLHAYSSCLRKYCSREMSCCKARKCRKGICVLFVTIFIEEDNTDAKRRLGEQCGCEDVWIPGAHETTPRGPRSLEATRPLTELLIWVRWRQKS